MVYGSAPWLGTWCIVINGACERDGVIDSRTESIKKNPAIQSQTSKENAVLIKYSRSHLYSRVKASQTGQQLCSESACGGGLVVAHQKPWRTAAWSSESGRLPPYRVTWGQRHGCKHPRVEDSASPLLKRDRSHTTKVFFFICRVSFYTHHFWRAWLCMLWCSRCLR